MEKILKLRGTVTTEQMEYARVEEQAMEEMYPITKPSEEVRLSHHRTLDSYIGEQAIKIILENRRISISADQVI